MGNKKRTKYSFDFSLLSRGRKVRIPKATLAVVETSKIISGFLDNPDIKKHF